MTEIAPYFAFKVIRAMTKTCAAHDIGLDGFGFVSLVAMQWDAIRYNRPVSYHLSALFDLLAITSKDSFYRLEKRCIAAGWLKKKNQGTRKPVLYWVEIPARFGEVPDTPSEDGQTNDRTNPRTNPGLITRPIPDSYPDSNRTHNQTPSSSSLSLNPIPSPDETAGADKPIGDPNQSIDPEQAWQMERLEPWARALKPILGNKLGPSTWESWKRLVVRFTASRVVLVLEAMDADQRWPDQTEIELKSSISDQPATVSKAAVRARELVAKHGLQQVQKLTGIPLETELIAVEALTENPSLAELIEAA